MVVELKSDLASGPGPDAFSPSDLGKLQAEALLTVQKEAECCLHK